MASAASVYAKPRAITNAGDCYFYHTMDIPGHGLVHGEWDLRGREKIYLGDVEFKSKTVLEIGTASGYLCYWMEDQGAEVTGLDLDKNRPWDLVPYYGLDQKALSHERYNTLERLNNSWWFTHAKRGSKAKCIYSSIYDLDLEHTHKFESGYLHRLLGTTPAKWKDVFARRSPLNRAGAGTFDVVTLCSILLHLRDPIRAIELACARARSEIIITDVSEYQFLNTKPHMHEELCLHFLPRAERKTPVDSWYFLPAPLVAEVLKVFGFNSVTVTRHTQTFKDGHDWQFYTVVGRR